MDKQFIAERCVEALNENEEYLNMEYSGDADPYLLSARREELCYRKGFLDCMALVMGK